MTMYGFRGGPVYRPGTPEQRLLTALDQPLSPLATMGQSVAQAVTSDNYLTGTIYRDFAIPRNPTDPKVAETEAGRALAVGAPLAALVVGGYELARDIFGAKATGKPLSLDDYKASPYFRDSVPWDAGMTEDRAASLALFEDTKRVREFYSAKQPIAAFVGSFAGAALDPINFIPVAGPLVKGVAVAKFGRIGGTAVAASLDAASNVALAGMLTAPIRAGFGDDVSFQAQVSDIAMAAMIGGAFGLAGGAIGKWTAESRARRALAVQVATDRLQTLRHVQQARIGLNEAAAGLALDGEVRLSPNSLEPMAELARSLVPDVVRQVEPRPADPVRPAETAQISGLEEALNNLRSGAGFAEVSMRKPVIDMLKRMGGVHPDSPLAAELRAIGITSRTAPGLYRREPMVTATANGPIVREPLRALDNVPLNEVADRFGGRGVDDGAGYVTEQGWLDAISAEARGEPWLTPDEQRRADEVRAPAEDLDEFMNRFGIEWQGRSNADVMAEIRAVEHALMEAAFDPSPARPDVGMGSADDAEWRARFANPEEVRRNGTLEAYRVDPATGDYLEESEIRQLEAEGRLTDEDREMLEEADRTFVVGEAYGEALRSAATCFL